MIGCDPSARRWPFGNKSRLPSVLLTFSSVCIAAAAFADDSPLLTGKRALGDWTTDAPGVRRRITPDDLPPPNATDSANNQPRQVKRPENAWPKVPDGFVVQEIASRLQNPRVIIAAPNGDFFDSESKANRVRVIRDANNDGRPELSETFLDGLNQPFGIAFYPNTGEPKFIYIANTDAVVRLPYRNGQTKADANPERIAELSGGARLAGGGHWTRDVVFSRDGKKMFVSVGSKSNVNDDAAEEERARIFEFDPDGGNKRVFATGIRNAVGLAIHPETGDLWASVNERDELGDDLVPDYVTHIQEGGFYGWPWFYIGPHQDPRHAGKHPELKEKVITPDVLIQSHSASLDMIFYTGTQFPSGYRGSAFAAEHGSWNRARRTGYKVVQIPMANGKATGEYIDFMTGFVTVDGNVWGRPVGVTVAKDGALLVTDDGGNCIWRVSYQGTGAN
jgi:glucose/arabinose dehydrogenase